MKRDEQEMKRDEQEMKRDEQEMKRDEQEMKRDEQEMSESLQRKLLAHLFMSRPPVISTLLCSMHVVCGLGFSLLPMEIKTVQVG